MSSSSTQFAGAFFFTVCDTRSATCVFQSNRIWLRVCRGATRACGAVEELYYRIRVAACGAQIAYTLFLHYYFFSNENSEACMQILYY